MPDPLSARAIYDVLLRSYALDALGDELDLAAARAAVDQAAGDHDFIAHRRALIDEAAITLLLVKRVPAPTS